MSFTSIVEVENLFWFSRILLCQEGHYSIFGNVLVVDAISEAAKTADEVVDGAEVEEVFQIEIF